MNRNIFSLILKATAVSMGVSTLVLNILGTIDVKGAITLLSIGVISLGILQLQEHRS
ncbi:hypothetical protein [Heliorestis acidaminivorans]|uniref:hypothetical protein n=1 Tax=Heliorestis acidaminivorans TaxID=553427 RepID=UPI001479405B|nr:hypothetical protein [Heliorestis acidaminivorans]